MRQTIPLLIMAVIMVMCIFPPYEPPLPRWTPAPKRQKKRR